MKPALCMYGSASSSSSLWKITTMKLYLQFPAAVLNCADVWEKSYSNIMKISEFALNEAKRNGKNRYNIFTSKDYENFLRKKQITKILRQSILNHFEGF